MSNLLRSSRVWSKSLKPAPAARTRSFHSPFAVLNTQSATRTPSIASSVYDKQVESGSEPTLTYGGSKTYVVSEPDPANAPYKVPAGAYPTSLPYVNFTATEAPEDAPMSSTSSTFAHPGLTTGETPLADRNPPPIDSEVVEKFSKMGVKDAWEARK